MVVENLGKYGSIILLHLYNNGKIMISDARHLGMGYGTFYRSLIPLLQMDLIKEKKSSSGAKRVFVLTDLGKKVASKLKEIDELLNSVAKP